jgi:hypothetical protein
VTAEVVDNGTGVKVTVSGKRASFFGDLLPPGGWNVHAEATASAMNQTPLCVLTTGLANKDELTLFNGAGLTAPACLVHSNASIEVKNQAKLAAQAVQTSGQANGTITPAAGVGAPEIEDPFLNLSFSTPGHLSCATSSGPPLFIEDETPVDLPPGRHGQDITVRKGGTLRLKDGDYYFTNVKLQVIGDARIEGTNALLVFDKDSDFKFTDNAVVDLEGRRTGAYAGFVIATPKNNSRTFEISSAAARNLLGTLYFPSATLVVSGSNKVADESAWTIIVAKALQLKEKPTLVVNADYAGASFGPPAGVGSVTTQYRLTR